MAWAYERPDGGRGFGFTGFHKYANLENDSFRTLLLNAVAARRLRAVTHLDVDGNACSAAAEVAAAVLRAA